LDNFFRKLKNSSFFVRLDVERTHINQKMDFFENPTSACQTIVRRASQYLKLLAARAPTHARDAFFVKKKN
jgi:hypothetical protein